MIIEKINPSQISLAITLQNYDGSAKTNISSATVRVYHIATGSEVDDLSAQSLVQVGSTNVWRYIWTPGTLAANSYVAEYSITDSDSINAKFKEDIIIGYLETKVDSIQSSIENATYGLSALQVLIDAIDTSTELTSRFDEIKGAGWTNETLKSIQDAIDAIVDNVDWTDAEKKQIRSALGIDGDKVTAQNGQLQSIDTNVTSVKGTVENVTYGLSALKTLIDLIDTSTELTAKFDSIKGVGWTTETLKVIKDAVDDIDVSELATSAEIATLQVLINRILGLSQENYRILNPIYNDNHLLLSATIRIYGSASDCTNDISPIASYTITATYNDDNEMLTYKVIKN